MDENHVDRDEECDDRLPGSDISLEESHHRVRLLHVLEYLEENDPLLISERKF
jgi:hypothetical protein